MDFPITIRHLGEMKSDLDPGLYARLVYFNLNFKKTEDKNGERFFLVEKGRIPYVISIFPYNNGFINFITSSSLDFSKSLADSLSQSIGLSLNPQDLRHNDDVMNSIYSHLLYDFNSAKRSLESLDPRVFL